LGSTLDDQGLAVATDATGAYVTGHYRGNVTIGGTVHAGSTTYDSLFVAKLQRGVADLSAAAIWYMAPTGTDAVKGRAIAAHGGIIYAAGTFKGTMTYGATTAGNVTTPQTLVSSAYDDCFLLKVEGAGSVTLAVQVSGSGTDTATGVARDPLSGHVTMVGYTTSLTMSVGGAGFARGGGIIAPWVANVDTATGSVLWGLNFTGG